MFGLLVFLFTVVPAVELYLLFKIGGQIGAFNTMFIVLFTGVVGAALAKSQGLSILMKIQNDFNRGQLPTNQIIHGLMVFAGGLLLLTPGFMTDILGLSLVMPGPRHLLMVWVKHAIEKGLQSGNIHFKTFGANNADGFYSYTYQQQSTDNGSHPYTAFENTQSTSQQVEADIIEAEYTKKE